MVPAAHAHSTGEGAESLTLFLGGIAEEQLTELLATI